MIMNSLQKKPGLTKAQMTRIDDLFNNFSRIESNALKFQEYIHLVIDRAMLSNRYTLSLFRDAYFTAIERELTDMPDFASKLDHKMTKQQFVNFLKAVSKTLFPTEKDPIDYMFKTLLVERSTINMRDAIEPPKVLAHDELSKRLLSESSIEVLCSFEKELQITYCLYNSDNLRYDKMMLLWREIAIQNNKMSSYGLIKFLVDADIIPRLLGPENLNEIVVKITPPITIKEHNFFQNGVFSQIFDKDVPKSNEVTYDGDPHYFFHEFVLILARTALETLGKGQDKKEDSNILIKFFKEHLLIRFNEEVDQNKPLPDINRPFMRRLTKAYQSAALKDRKASYNDASEEEYDEGEGEEGEEEDEVEDTPDDNDIFNAELANLDLGEVYKKLDKELPKIPDELKIQPQNPPSFDKPKTYIGAPIPKDPKKQQKPAPKRPKMKKKDEEPEPNWAGFPELRKQMATENVLDYRAGIQRDIDSNKQDSGSMSDIEVAPTIIKEVLYPPAVPEEVTTFLEAAILSHNSANYSQSIRNYDKALNAWAKILEEVPDEIMLYFEFAKGLVYESANRDDYAFYHFLNSRTYIEKLPFNSADRAIPYCGIGSVLYKTFDFQWALRSFLKALEIREKIFGPQSIDSATVYNNVGCCMFFLERVQEARNYFELSHAIFELELGPYHYRTLTAKRNFTKCTKLPLKVAPAFSVMWSTLQLNRFPKKKKGAKGKKGKK